MKKMKHEMLNAAELLSRGLQNVALHFVERRLPRFPYEDKEGKQVGTLETHAYGHNHVPEFMVVTKISNDKGTGYGPNCFLISYINEDDGYPSSMYIYAKYPLKMLTGKTAAVKMEEVKALKIKSMHKQLGHSFTIGADPEIFVVDETDKVLPAFNFLKAKQDAARHTTDGRSGLYWDGFQAEFEVVAGTCLDGVSTSIYNGIVAVQNAARALNNKAKLSLKSVMEIPEAMLKSSKPEHVSLGCSPSLNIYGSKGLEVTDPKELKIRPAGGHIHYGLTATYGKLTEKQISNIVKALDSIIGVACVSLFANYDSPERRKYYGLAGEYRLPKHGLEYRTLSNAWLAHPLITNLVIDISRKAVMFGYNNFNEVWKATEKETVECINNCDVALARQILTRNEELFKKIILAAYYDATQDQLNAVFNIFMKGMDVAVDKPEDVYNNWINAKIRRFREAKPILAQGKKVA